MGNNIKDLDALHRVMKGDMTHDGSFYKIGDITHRKDGDYRKVAEGKWVPVKGSSKAKSFRDNLQDVINSSPNLKGRNVDEIIKVLEAAGYDTNVTGGNISKRNTETGTPVKADGQGQMGAGENASEKPAEPKGGGTESDGPDTAMQDERSQFKFRKHITHAIPMGKQEEIALNRISSYFEGGKRNASDARDNYADHLIKENMEKGNNNEAQERAVMRIAYAIGYGHELHDKIKRGRNGYDFGYADEQGSFYEGDDDGFLEPNITESEPDDEPPYEYDNPAPRMSELSISEETGRDKFMDKLTTFSEKYNDPSKVTVWKTEKGNWDTYYDGHRLGLIGGDQINDDLAKKLGWYQGDYSQDSAAPRLTRDTKIRLSRIKREQTQDERRTYKIGEISEKTGLQKTANGWREVKKGASPAGGKMSKEDLTKRVGEMLETDPTMRKMVGAGPAPKADPAKMSKEQLTQRVGELMKTDKNLQKVVKAAGGTIPGGKANGGSGAGQPFKPKAIRLGPNGVEAVSNIAFDIPTDWKAKFPEAARYVAEREEKGYATKLGDAIVKEIVTNGGGDPQKTAELLNNSKIGYTDWQPGLNTEAFFTIKTTDLAGNTRQLKIWK